MYRIPSEARVLREPLNHVGTNKQCLTSLDHSIAKSQRAKLISDYENLVGDYEKLV